MKLRIGTRDSKLAVVQTELFVQALGRVRPEIETEIVAMKTTGDKILDRTLELAEKACSSRSWTKRCWKAMWT